MFERSWSSLYRHSTPYFVVLVCVVFSNRRMCWERNKLKTTLMATFADVQVGSVQGASYGMRIYIHNIIIRSCNIICIILVMCCVFVRSLFSNSFSPVRTCSYVHAVCRLPSYTYVHAVCRLPSYTYVHAVCRLPSYT